MDEYVKIPVTYKKAEREFESRLFLTDYTHKFEVEVDDQLIVFELDEDQNYRALVKKA